MSAVVGRALPDGHTRLAWSWLLSLKLFEREQDMSIGGNVVVAEWRRRCLSDLLAGEPVRVRRADLWHAGFEPPAGPHPLGERDIRWWLHPDGTVTEIDHDDPLWGDDNGSEGTHHG